RGEAFFDVTPDKARPFTVPAGTDRVRVLGTSFVVRNEPQDFSVTLVTGRLEVTAPNQPSVVLAAGDRALRTEGQGLRIDQPQVQAVTAWQRGEIILANTRLSDAVREFNRYTDVPIVVGGADVGELR